MHPAIAAPLIALALHAWWIIPLALVILSP